MEKEEPHNAITSERPGLQTSVSEWQHGEAAQISNSYQVEKVGHARMIAYSPPSPELQAGELRAGIVSSFPTSTFQCRGVAFECLVGLRFGGGMLSGARMLSLSASCRKTLLTL